MPDLEFKNIHQKHLYLIEKIKVPKVEDNSFGKYKYRNIEAIYNKLKEFLPKCNATIRIDNSIEVIDGLFYRKSIATLTCVESAESVSTTMYTRETFDKKGMSLEQMSGTTASYGDKYALGKLLCLDDCKDVDSFPPEEETKQIKKKVKKLEPASKKDQIRILVQESGLQITETTAIPMRTFDPARLDKLITKLKEKAFKEQSELDNFVYSLQEKR